MIPCTAMVTHPWHSYIGFPLYCQVLRRMTYAEMLVCYFPEKCVKCHNIYVQKPVHVHRALHTFLRTSAAHRTDTSNYTLIPMTTPIPVYTQPISRMEFFM